MGMEQNQERQQGDTQNVPIGLTWNSVSLVWIKKYNLTKEKPY